MRLQAARVRGPRRLNQVPFAMVILTNTRSGLSLYAGDRGALVVAVPHFAGGALDGRPWPFFWCLVLGARAAVWTRRWPTAADAERSASCCPPSQSVGGKVHFLTGSRHSATCCAAIGAGGSPLACAGTKCMSLHLSVGLHVDQHVQVVFDVGMIGARAENSCGGDPGRRGQLRDRRLLHHLRRRRSLRIHGGGCGVSLRALRLRLRQEPARNAASPPVTTGRQPAAPASWGETTLDRCPRSGLLGQLGVGLVGGGRIFDRQLRCKPAGAGDAAEAVVLAVEAAAHVDHAGVAGRLEQRGGLQRAAARLAADDELGVAREVGGDDLLEIAVRGSSGRPRSA